MVSRRNVFAQILIAIGIVMVAIFNLVPLVWGILASFKPVHQLVTYPPTLFDFKATLEHYQTVVGGSFMMGVRNSALYSFASVVVALVIGAFAAFGFDRFEFRGKSTMFLLIIACIP